MYQGTPFNREQVRFMVDNILDAGRSAYEVAWETGFPAEQTAVVMTVGLALSGLYQSLIEESMTPDIALECAGNFDDHCRHSMENKTAFPIKDNVDAFMRQFNVYFPVV